MKYNLDIIQIPGTKLSEESLPIKNLQVLRADLDQAKVFDFKKIIKVFTEQGDSIISEICSNLEKNLEIKTNVILSNGIPDPYDAWTAKWNGQSAIFFNLDLWNQDEIKTSTLPIIKHEITHLILEPYLSSRGSNSFVAQLERIVLDEGIAHFVGFSQNREELLEKWIHKWEPAELELKNAFNILEDIQKDVSTKNQLILKSHIGSFWNKFGAVTGMFRAAQIYQRLGSVGLVSVIRKNHLPKSEY